MHELTRKLLRWLIQERNRKICPVPGQPVAKLGVVPSISGYGRVGERRCSNPSVGRFLFAQGPSHRSCRTIARSGSNSEAIVNGHLAEWIDPTGTAMKARCLLMTTSRSVSLEAPKTKSSPYLQKKRLTQEQNTFEIIVDEKPTRAGIDPYNKLIDHINVRWLAHTRLSPKSVQAGQASILFFASSRHLALSSIRAARS